MSEDSTLTGTYLAPSYVFACVDDGLCFDFKILLPRDGTAGTASSFSFSSFSPSTFIFFHLLSYFSRLLVCEKNTSC